MPHWMLPHSPFTTIGGSEFYLSTSLTLLPPKVMYHSEAPLNFRISDERYPSSRLKPNRAGVPQCCFGHYQDDPHRPERMGFIGCCRGSSLLTTRRTNGQS